jgi:Skp family chaperone for outer membrane proteins
MEEKKSMLLEGLLPVDVWNAIIVLLILFGVAIALLKGIAFIREEIQKNKDRKKINTKDITDEIADKVFEKVKPQIDEKFKEFSDSFDKKFEEIDSKLSADKEELKSHTTQLNDHEDRVSRLEGGDRSLCQGMLALLEQNPSLTKQTHAMQNYLISGKYNEEDWK